MTEPEYLTIELKAKMEAAGWTFINASYHLCHILRNSKKHELHVSQWEGPGGVVWVAYRLKPVPNPDFAPDEFKSIDFNAETLVSYIAALSGLDQDITVDMVRPWLEAMWHKGRHEVQEEHEYDRLEDRD